MLISETTRTAAPCACDCYLLWDSTFADSAVFILDRRDRVGLPTLIESGGSFGKRFRAMRAGEMGLRNHSAGLTVPRWIVCVLHRRQRRQDRNRQRLSSVWWMADNSFLSGLANRVSDCLANYTVCQFEKRNRRC